MEMFGKLWQSECTYKVSKKRVKPSNRYLPVIVGKSMLQYEHSNLHVSIHNMYLTRKYKYSSSISDDVFFICYFLTGGAKVPRNWSYILPAQNCSLPKNILICRITRRVSIIMTFKTKSVLYCIFMTFKRPVLRFCLLGKANCHNQSYSPPSWDSFWNFGAHCFLTEQMPMFFFSLLIGNCHWPKIFGK